MLEAIKVALDPTPKQKHLLISHAGAARFAYNAGLAHVKDMLEKGEPPEWAHYALRRWWNANKDTLAVSPDTGVVWWSQNSKEAYSMALRDLAQALSNWSKSRKGQRKGKRVGFPRFKLKSTTMRFAYSTNFTAPPTANDPYGLKLPCIGRIHCMENVYKHMNGARLIRINVACRAGRWYANLTIEREPSIIIYRPKRGTVGIDLGIKHLATLSDSTVIPNPRALDTKLKALRKAQQALSRKTKGSTRREKAREHVARLYASVTDMRMDTINKATTMIARTYTTVCIEDLNVAGMMKNHHLARRLSDASLGEFRRQLEYKTMRTGASLRVVDRWYPSSKTCSNCGTVKAKLSLNERVYRCDVCGLSMDRDLNAAINIMVAGSAPETLNARGGDVRRADIVSGNADPSETRTKQPPIGDVRLGAGLGNETMRAKTN